MRGRKKTVGFSISFPLLAIATLFLQIAHAVDVEPTNEAANWKLYPTEKYIGTFFPCEIVGEQCKKMYGEGFWKYYFDDGFVLTLNKQGKLLDAYYALSEQHYIAFVSNFKNIISGKIRTDSPYLTKRFALMRAYASKDLDKLMVYAKGEEDDSFLEFVIFDMFHVGLFEKAIDNLNQIVDKLADRKGKYLAIRALAYKALNMDTEFRQDAERAYGISPEEKWAMVTMALVYLQEKRGIEALELLAKIDKSPLFSLFEAIAYASVGRIEEAMEIYQTLPQDFIESDSPWFQTYFRWLYGYFMGFYLASAREAYRRNQVDKAIEFYKEVLKFTNEDETLQVIKESLPLIEKRPEMLKFNEEARKALIRAEIYLSENNVVKAIREYKKAIRLSPFVSDTYRTLAQVYARIGQYKQAIKYMQIVLELNPKHPEYEIIKDQIYKWEFLYEQQLQQK